MQTETKASETGAKHTPGPWSREWIHAAIRYINKHVDTDDFLSEEEQGAWIRGEVHSPNVLACPGDAHLIAAAPDLLAALEASMRTLHGLHYVDDIWSCAAPLCVANRDAIAKAKGGAR